MHICVSCSRHRGYERNMSRATGVLILSDSLAGILASTKGRFTKNRPHHSAARLQRHVPETRLARGAPVRRAFPKPSGLAVSMQSMVSSGMKSTSSPPFSTALLHQNADIQHYNMGGRDTEETEMAPNPANSHTKPRKMDQKSCRVELRILKESRKTSQEMGRRLE